MISNYKEYKINDKQLHLLTKLRKVIQEFNSNIRFDLGSDFLHSPEWIDITLIAKEVLRTFHYQQAKNVKKQS